MSLMLTSLTSQPMSIAFEQLQGPALRFCRSRDPNVTDLITQSTGSIVIRR